MKLVIFPQLLLSKCHPDVAAKYKIPSLGKIVLLFYSCFTVVDNAGRVLAELGM
jgi:hypothetical protein